MRNMWIKNGIRDVEGLRCCMPKIVLTLAYAVNWLLESHLLCPIHTWRIMQHHGVDAHLPKVIAIHMDVKKEGAKQQPCLGNLSPIRVRSARCSTILHSFIQCILGNYNCQWEYVSLNCLSSKKKLPKCIPVCWCKLSVCTDTLVRVLFVCIIEKDYVCVSRLQYWGLLFVHRHFFACYSVCSHQHAFDACGNPWCSLI